MTHRSLLSALLSILLLLAAFSLAYAEDGSARLSGKIELGAGAVNLTDNPARVNEYPVFRKDDGINLVPKLSLGYQGNDSLFELDSEIAGSKDQQHAIDLDFKRILQLGFDYQSFEHRLDHETLEQMGATMRGDIGGGQPSVTSDQTFADVLAANGATSIGGASLSYDPAAAVAQELSNEYLITHREWEAESSMTLPSLPNITFHAGLRVEEREGLKQAIGVTKCDSCHVSAVGKSINEHQEDLRLGATGRFGALTVEYEYLARTFDEDGATPTRYYEDAGNPSANDQLLYENGDLEFNRTPDSEKDSHLVKARYDFSANTSLTGSYVQADVESNKAEPASDISYQLLDGDTLKTEFQSFGGKFATRLGDWRLSARGSSYSIDAQGNQVALRSDLTTRDDNNLLAFPLTYDWPSAEERDVHELGLDAVYRLARGTTLRLGYDYEQVDRQEVELGETTTNSFKVAVKSRLGRKLSGRISYLYQDINDPFHAADATGIAQGIGTTDPNYPGLAWLNTGDFIGIDNNSNSMVWYWNSVYPNRTMDATNQPDEVHEAKFASTWTPSANLAATLFARVRMEENSTIGYSQDSYVPGASIYYAPTNNLNLTMAYTFNKQETENKMCVGWYHG